MVHPRGHCQAWTAKISQYFGELGQDLKVFRNNKITIPEIEDMHPETIVISPGPGTPKDAGISLEVIRHFAGTIPILGVCLGHQAMGIVSADSAFAVRG